MATAVMAGRPSGYSYTKPGGGGGYVGSGGGVSGGRVRVLPSFALINNNNIDLYLRELIREYFLNEDTVKQILVKEDDNRQGSRFSIISAAGLSAAEQVRQILLREEIAGQGRRFGGGFGGGFVGGFGGGIGGGVGGGISSSYGPPSPQYGVPSSSYGVPHHSDRIIGIDMEDIKEAIQVAQYHQASTVSFGGYPSGPSKPSGSYGAPH
ncbi:hypothetical protein ILUMI_07858 [Ignelater luminosus]|uniref:Uncharacterized protein n=1 Tax=Ignelater luminosus TaxID=2038154 RepID=A0A8K0DCJ8_IGNLU|nr:hypothetical protein ILUMI_07858 [Ignelater luminosus]